MAKSLASNGTVSDNGSGNAQLTGRGGCSGLLAKCEYSENRARVGRVCPASYPHRPGMVHIVNVVLFAWTNETNAFAWTNITSLFARTNTCLNFRRVSEACEEGFPGEQGGIVCGGLVRK